MRVETVHTSQVFHVILSTTLLDLFQVPDPPEYGCMPSRFSKKFYLTSDQIKTRTLINSFLTKPVQLEALKSTDNFQLFSQSMK